MKGVGEQFPDFNLKAVVSCEKDNAFKQISLESLKNQWKLFFFWPKDFTFVCPTEIAEFGKLNSEFTKRECAVLGCSTDSEFVHLAWRQNHTDLKNLPIPMLSDIKHELCNNLGILDPKEGVAQRATFLVDPDNIIRFCYTTDLSVGRNPNEVLRVLTALQTNELCPCNWEEGKATL
jgi:lipoyl-dependent peroxiredoxin subunit C